MECIVEKWKLTFMKINLLNILIHYYYYLSLPQAKFNMKLNYDNIKDYNIRNICLQESLISPKNIYPVISIRSVDKWQLFPC